MAVSLFHGDLVTSSRILYTPSTFARTSLLHLQEIGELHAQKPHTSQRSDLQSHLFLIVIQGSGTLFYRGEEYRLSAGQCAWINCIYSYYHRTSNDLWQLQWIHFDGPTLSAVYEKYQERGGTPVFSTKNCTSFSQLWQTLYDTANSFSHIRDMHINEQLNNLLTMLMAESWHPEAQNKQATKRQNLQQVKNYLDQHFAQKISLDELSNHFFINKYYLLRIFREKFGITINSYLTSVRITQAKHLLRFTDMSLNDIAQACGLQNANYLNRVFRKVEGIGPSNYRRKW